ncbi:uncharacterized protein V1516DRAFT_581889 [Lipomyces oligophaga]|uniref:uncharacterized protein n=1 Tax=Lipomyces oligophaga TaxID=45792 RepID=UPI0034CF2BEC
MPMCPSFRILRNRIIFLPAGPGLVWAAIYFYLCLHCSVIVVALFGFSPCFASSLVVAVWRSPVPRTCWQRRPRLRVCVSACLRVYSSFDSFSSLGCTARSVMSLSFRSCTGWPCPRFRLRRRQPVPTHTDLHSC